MHSSRDTGNKRPLTRRGDLLPERRSMNEELEKELATLAAKLGNHHRAFMECPGPSGLNPMEFADLSGLGPSCDRGHLLSAAQIS